MPANSFAASRHVRRKDDTVGANSFAASRHVRRKEDTVGANHAGEFIRRYSPV